MEYHATMVDLIYQILSKGEEYLNQVDSGNAYDKIIRNYHQFNDSGEKVYKNHNRMMKYYRFSENAWKNREDKSLLYHEHLVPVKIIKLELKKLIKQNEVTIENIEQILDKTEIVVITNDEQKKLDAEYKTTIPSNGNDRLTEMGIYIDEATKNNSIF